MEENDDDELQLSLSESFHSLHMSEVATNYDKDKQAHILHNVEEWKSRKEAKEKGEAVEKLQQFKVKLVSTFIHLKLLQGIFKLRFCQFFRAKLLILM